MKDYVKRMIEEYHELNKKRDKLAVFLKDSEEKISEKENSLMFAQLNAMNVYAFILATRLGVECEKGNCKAEDYNS